VSGVRPSCGVDTDRWGFQPAAWVENGLPTFAWRCAPKGLLTRRQMREQGLCPGGAFPVAQIVCRRGRVRALLFDPGDLKPKRVPTAAQLVAVGKALAARRWCQSCRTDVGYTVPTSLGECIDCHYPTEDQPGPKSVTTGVGNSASTGAEHTTDRPARAA